MLIGCRAAAMYVAMAVYQTRHCDPAACLA